VWLDHYMLSQPSVPHALPCFNRSLGHYCRRHDRPRPRSPRPDYQHDTVATFLEDSETNIMVCSSAFAVVVRSDFCSLLEICSSTGRGLPDILAQGLNIKSVFNRKFLTLGTHRRGSNLVAARHLFSASSSIGYGSWDAHLKEILGWPVVERYVTSLVTSLFRDGTVYYYIPQS